MLHIELAKLLPHAKPMLLLDELTHKDECSATCKVVIAESNIFYDAAAQGIYAWISVEYMAQTIAAFAGIHSYPEPPLLGLLLSVRKLKTTQALFKKGQQLFITAQKQYFHDSIGAFDCHISIDDAIVVTAKLNTVAPPPEQLDTILRGQIT